MPEAKPEHPRSPKWPEVEKAYRTVHPRCACCADDKHNHSVQVHHHFPFDYCISLGRSDLELDDRNLISLCESGVSPNHHLLIGHLDNWFSSNLAVENDAVHTFHGMSAVEIRANRQWQDKVANRLKPLGEMTTEDKKAFEKLMNATLPKR